MDNTQLSKPLLTDFKSLEKASLLSITVNQELKSSQIQPSSIDVGDKKTQLDPMKEALVNISAEFNNLLPSEVNVSYWISNFVTLSDETHILACTFEGVVLYIDLKTKKVDEKKICDELICVVVLKGEEKAIFSSQTTLYEVKLPSLLLVKEKTFNFGTRINKTILSLDQNFLYVLVFNQGIVKVNLENFSERENFLEGYFFRIALSKNGELAALSSNDKLILKNFHTSSQEEVKISYNGDNRYVEFSHSQSKIIVPFTNSVAIINVNPLEVYRVLTIKRDFWCAAIANDENILIVGDAIGNLLFWDIKNQEQLSEIPVHYNEVVNVKLSTDGQLIYTNGLDMRICTLNFPNLTKDLSTSIDDFRISPLGAELIISPKNGIFKKWDLSSNKIQDLGVIDEYEIDRYDIIDDSTIIIIYSYAIIKYNLKTKEKIEISLKDEDEIKCAQYAISPDKAYLVVGGLSLTVFLIDLKAMKKIKEFKGTDSCIWEVRFLAKSNVIVAGSGNGTVYFWSIESGEFVITPIRKEEGKGVWWINSFHNEENVAISYEDGSILVFNWKSKILLATLKPEGTIKRTLIVKDEKTMIVATKEGKIFFWDLLTFTLLFYSDIKQTITAFKLTADEKYFAIKVEVNEENKEKEENEKDEGELRENNNPDNLIIKKNPLVTGDVIAVGPGSELDYMEYVMDLIKHEGNQYKPEYDKWVIMPYRINTLHLYAYYNHPNKLKLAIDAGGSLFNTNFDESALSLAVKKQFSGCVSTIMSSFGKLLKGNPYALNFISAECINGLNMLGYPYLNKFYKLIYTPYKGKFVKFVDESISTPIYYHSKEIYPLVSNFLQENQRKTEGKPVKCMVTSLPLPLVNGSKASTDFLDSLEKCPNSEIFTTKLIQDILDNKWDELKWAMYFQALIYTIYMILLSVYILYFIGQSLPLLIIFLFSLLLTSYEVIQFVVSPSEYIEDIWNYVDAIRTILMVVYASTVWSEGKHTDLSYNILVGLVIVSWTRGISYFRIFKNTRYMINLITQVIKDITSFLILLFYSTLAFAFIFLVLDKNDPKLIDYVKISYQLDLGDFDSSNFTSTQWACLFLATMINTIIMLNLLISIMGDTFGKVQESAEIADRKELLGMITEIETLMFWKKNITERSYFQALIGEESEEAEKNVNTKLSELKKNQKLYHLQSQKNAEKNFENVEKRLENLEKRFENQGEMMKKIWNKLEGDAKKGDNKERDKSEEDAKEGDKIEGDKEEGDKEGEDEDEVSDEKSGEVSGEEEN